MIFVHYFVLILVKKINNCNRHSPQNSNDTIENALYLYTTRERYSLYLTEFFLVSGNKCIVSLRQWFVAQIYLYFSATPVGGEHETYVQTPSGFWICTTIHDGCNYFILSSDFLHIMGAFNTNKTAFFLYMPASDI